MKPLSLPPSVSVDMTSKMSRLSKLPLFMTFMDAVVKIGNLQNKINNIPTSTFSFLSMTKQLS